MSRRRGVGGLSCALLALSLGLASCHEQPPARAPNNAWAPKAQRELVPVAQYLGSDEATGNRIRVLLLAQGIESAAVGSLGYTVSVGAGQADKARNLIRTAVEKEGLKATVLGGQPVASTRPAAHPSGSATPATVLGKQPVASTDPVPEHLRYFPGLSVWRNGKLMDAPPEDVTLARKYPSIAAKGPIKNGMRLTLMSAKLRYRANEEVRVVHVFEATEKGRTVYVMGPKEVHGEYVDGKLATSKPPTDAYPWLLDYSGRILQSPRADYNYQITTYRWSVPGRHRIQWRLGDLESNLLEIEVVARTR